MELIKAEYAALFLKELEKQARRPGLGDGERLNELQRLMDLFFIEATRLENLAFTTMFSRISYVCHRAEVPGNIRRLVHLFRKKIRERSRDAGEGEDLLPLGLYALAHVFSSVGKVPIPASLQELLTDSPSWDLSEAPVLSFLPYVRCVAVQIDPVRHRLLVVDETREGSRAWVQYNMPDRNENFNPTIRCIEKIYGLPATLGLIDVEVGPEEDGYPVYRPRGFVLDPDYLIDVTNVANCFGLSKPQPMVYLLKKFIPSESSYHLMLGQLANLFLDELMHDPNATFEQIIPKAFRLRPLAFAGWQDDEVRRLIDEARAHWRVLVNQVTRELPRKNISRAKAFIEPSFYDPAHGIQGRLDIFHSHGGQRAIVELKSGTAFNANHHKIGAAHFIQILLYDLMVKATFGPKVNNVCYILYSKEALDPLRYGPPNREQQMEAIKERNSIVAIDRLLTTLDPDPSKPSVLELLNQNRLQLMGFVQRDLERFEVTYRGLDNLEKRYFRAFTAFIAREQQLAKTGIQGVERANGLASIWLDTPEEKEERFELLRNLRIKSNLADQDEPMLHFSRSESPSRLANFRVGDIVLLYPNTDQRSGFNPLPTQVFKGTLVEIDPEQVSVRLRYRQYNDELFKTYLHWNIEHDLMEYGFNAMYHGLFRFSECPEEKRRLLLARRPPKCPEADVQLPTLPQSLSPELQEILARMISAPEYFLLWGPPGTGKTKIMLRHFTEWIFNNTGENLLLLAYTNRAVDEMCEVLVDLGGDIAESFLRIGSLNSIDSAFTDKLLDKKIEQVNRRAELKEVLEAHRIVVSTVASLAANMEILSLKKFRRVVIDEASQLLEPQLVGLLPQFEQFILIGDHKQLPAVVVQPEEVSRVVDEPLQGIGLTNLRNSLFERLYKKCQENGWHWACGRLRHQGRMHKDIMVFPSEHFYEKELHILPSNGPGEHKQTKPLDLPHLDHPLALKYQLHRRRMVFIDTPVDESTCSFKTNVEEARLVAQLVEWYRRVMPPGSTIGVITPYRAQIACILQAMADAGVDATDITVDTVERYQGGARDVILISLCTNTFGQLESLSSLSEDGVDRRLNVALTRAREVAVILGNARLLRSMDIYRKLIAHCEGEVPPQ